MRPGAFTLLELLLVVAILAVVGLALVPGSASSDAERKVAEDHLALSAAVKTESDHRLAGSTTNFN